MIDLINFKSVPNHDLKSEFEKCDSRLRFIFYSYVCYIYQKYGYIPTVTGVDRTQPEQDELYKNDPLYQVRNWMSVHQTDPCRGLDFRSFDMTKDILLDTERYFKQVKYNDVKSTLLYHIGHLHLQTNSSDITILKII